MTQMRCRAIDGDWPVLTEPLFDRLSPRGTERQRPHRP